MDITKDKNENPLKGVLPEIVSEVINTAVARENNGSMVDGGYVDFFIGATCMAHAIDTYFLGGDPDIMRTSTPALLLAPTTGRAKSANKMVAHIRKTKSHWLHEIFETQALRAKVEHETLCRNRP